MWWAEASLTRRPGSVSGKFTRRPGTSWILTRRWAIRALEKELEGRPGEIGVVLATAHPAKFAEVVEPILGKEHPHPTGARGAAWRGSDGSSPWNPGWRPSGRPFRADLRLPDGQTSQVTS